MLTTRDSHIIMADGNTVYARGFKGPVELGMHYNLVRVGVPLRDPDDNQILGYNGVFTGAGHVTRAGDPATLIMTESTRETYPGDKLFPGDVDVPLDFVPSSPRNLIKGQIMEVSDGVTRHRPVSSGRHQPRCSRRPGARQRARRVPEGRTRPRQRQARASIRGVSFMAPKVRLPDERTGTFMVFKTFDRMSYGLIMEATDVIRVTDNVESP